MMIELHYYCQCWIAVLMVIAVVLVAGSSTKSGDVVAGKRLCWPTSKTVASFPTSILRRTNRSRLFTVVLSAHHEQKGTGMKRSKRT